jgi:hypothetical protein
MTEIKPLTDEQIEVELTEWQAQKADPTPNRLYHWALATVDHLFVTIDILTKKANDADAENEKLCEMLIESERCLEAESAQQAKRIAELEALVTNGEQAHIALDAAWDEKYQDLADRHESAMQQLNELLVETDREREAESDWRQSQMEYGRVTTSLREQIATLTKERDTEKQMRVDMAKELNIPVKYYDNYAVYGTSSISYVETLRSENERLKQVSRDNEAAWRKENKWLKGEVAEREDAVVEAQQALIEAGSRCGGDGSIAFGISDLREKLVECEHAYNETRKAAELSVGYLQEKLAQAEEMAEAVDEALEKINSSQEYVIGVLSVALSTFRAAGEKGEGE